MGLPLCSSCAIPQLENQRKDPYPIILLYDVQQTDTSLYFDATQHARHHAATGSMERDEVFVPKTRSQVGFPPAHVQQQQQAAAAAHKQGESTFEALDEILEDAPFWNLFWVTMQQLLGWPMYLIRNASGQKYGRWTNRECSLSLQLLRLG